MTHAETSDDLTIPDFLDASKKLTALVDRASKTLASAGNAAQILEAVEQIGTVYDDLKRHARLAKAKGAHDEIIAKVHRAQADILELEAQAKRRLADEYDAAQARGEVAERGKPVNVPDGNIKPTTADLGLSRKDIHEAREVRDAEDAEPGIVRRVVDEALAAGEEPTRAKVKRAVKAKSQRKRKPRQNFDGPIESQHDRDLAMLRGVWEATCESARAAFLQEIT
jgi:hypothetical protein